MAEKLAALDNNRGFAGIDTSTVIEHKTGINISWTATKDCWCFAQIAAITGAGAAVYIDNVYIAGTRLQKDGTYFQYTLLIPVKQGQTVTTRNVTGQDYDLTFYPVKY